MDYVKFQQEITDRLGNTPVAFSLKSCFSRNNTMLTTAAEIRIRASMPLCVIDGNKNKLFIDANGDTVLAEKAYIPSKEEVNRIFAGICRSSLYAYKEDIKCGYITLKGGHRVGIAGKMLPDGAIYDISSMNIRIARQVKGCSKNVIRHIIKNDREVFSTLIISPPACGKTTVIRDIARILGTGNAYLQFKGISVGIIDERSEIAACYNGVPSNDVGKMTDVYDACPKEKGIMMMIRSMAPEVIITDEIGGKGDAAAVESAINAGMKIIATAHGSCLTDMKKRNEIGAMMGAGVFEKYIIFDCEKGPGTLKEVIFQGKQVVG
ncbi:MAG: stage III sporulation protein AA [Ruminococcaceae bacterium]|nr:stage III sporulation protein AA [Oscillospiraceae bacterium]